MSSEAGTDGVVVTDVWADVIAEPEVLSRLRRAAVDSTHAIMLVGPAGHGTRRAAAALAAEILATQTGDPVEAERHRTLALAERHPAVTLIERTGAALLADQASEVVRRASTSPVEGARQVIVLTDMHLAAKTAPVLLKSIEEPPGSTFFIIMADDVPPELVTIASRCMRFDLPPVPAGVIAGRLLADGVPSDVAELAARSSGGDADRARLLASDERLEARRDFWMSVPRRLDGTGSTVGALVEEALGLVEEVLAPLEATQEIEMAAALDDVERMGLAKGVVKDLEARHKRESRRVRADELNGGLTVLVATYRDAVTAGADPDLYVSAADAVRQTSERLVFNPNEELALQALFADLPRLPG